MLRQLIAFCLSRRPLALIAYGLFLGIGYYAFTSLNVEAYPDPAPPIIEIIAQYPGQSPEEVERYVTIPLEIAVASTPGLTYIRSNTVFALGFIPPSRAFRRSSAEPSSATRIHPSFSAGARSGRADGFGRGPAAGGTARSKAMAAHSDPMIEMYWWLRPCGNPALKYGGLTGAGGGGTSLRAGRGGNHRTVSSGPAAPR